MLDEGDSPIFSSKIFLAAGAGLSLPSAARILRTKDLGWSVRFSSRLLVFPSTGCLMATGLRPRRRSLAFPHTPCQ